MNGNTKEGTLRKKKATICLFDAVNDIANASNSNGNGSRIVQNKGGNTKVAYKKRKRTSAKINAKTEIIEGKVLIDLPIQTKSEANCFEPWRIKHARHKQQQKIVALALNPLRTMIKLPCTIMLTRFAPDSLDKFDNLPMSFKYIVDAVCSIITGDYRAGHADSDSRLSIACDQIKSKEYGIRIEITF